MLYQNSRTVYPATNGEVKSNTQQAIARELRRVGGGIFYGQIGEAPSRYHARGSEINNYSPTEYRPIYIYIKYR